MRKTKEEADVTRQKLLKAALVVFSHQGYSATRLEDIAAEAGVTRGAIYHHFGGKAELYNSLAATAAERVMPVIQQAIDEGGTPLTILRRLLVRTLEYVELDPDFRALNELIAFKTEVVPELQDGLNKKVEGTRGMVAFLAQLVQQGIEVGEIRADVEPHDAALALMGLQNGLLMLWLLDPALFSLRQRAAAVADLWAQGLAVR